MGDTVTVTRDQVAEAQAGIDAALSKVGEVLKAQGIATPSDQSADAVASKVIDLLKAQGFVLPSTPPEGDARTGEQTTKSEFDFDQDAAKYVDATPILKSFRDAIDRQAASVRALTEKVDGMLKSSNATTEVMKALAEASVGMAGLVKSFGDTVTGIASVPQPVRGVPTTAVGGQFAGQDYGQTIPVVPQGAMVSGEPPTILSKAFHAQTAGEVPHVSARAVNAALAKSMEEGKVAPEIVTAFELSRDPRILPPEVLAAAMGRA